MPRPNNYEPEPFDDISADAITYGFDLVMIGLISYNVFSDSPMLIRAMLDTVGVTSVMVGGAAVCFGAIRGYLLRWAEEGSEEY